MASSSDITPAAAIAGYSPRLRPAATSGRIPAGKLDSPDEAKIDCAYRELEEETGYRCDHLEYLMSVNTTIAFCDEALDIFLARDLKKTHQHLDPDEEIEVEAWELSDLLKRIYAGELTDGKTVSAILAYACKAGQK